MPTMSMTKEQAIEFFGEIYCGKHHIPGKHCEPVPWGDGWCVNHTGELSTFDFNKLTRLVFLAHDRCVRVSIQSSGPGMVRICIWQREKRTGSIFESHPAIETALEDWRKIHPLTEVLP